MSSWNLRDARHHFREHIWSENAKREGKMLSPKMKRLPSFILARKLFVAKAKMFLFNPPEVSFSVLCPRRWRLAPEVASSSSRASQIEKNKPSCGFWTSAHPRPASARCGHFFDQRSTASTNSSTSATRALRYAADVRFQSSAASVFAWAALWGEVRRQPSNARRGMLRGTRAVTAQGGTAVTLPPQDERLFAKVRTFATNSKRSLPSPTFIGTFSMHSFAHSPCTSLSVQAPFTACQKKIEFESYLTRPSRLHVRATWRTLATPSGW